MYYKVAFYDVLAEEFLGDKFTDWILENVWFRTLPASLFLGFGTFCNKLLIYCTNFDDVCLEFTATADRLLVLA